MNAEKSESGGRKLIERINIQMEDILLPKKKKQRWYKKYLVSFFAAVVLWTVIFYFTREIIYLAVSFAVLTFLFQFYSVARKSLKTAKNVKKMEEVFPDFISLMSSNLRAGMTIDQSLLLSSREEFAPLDKEIVRVGKDIVTGKKINIALNEMGVRINSDKIRKTIMLITSGIRAGGNLSTLLDQTSSNMRERNYVEKRAASNVLMYLIFIFFAVAVGAPVLFGLSTVVVEVLTKMMANLPVEQVSVNLPFTLTNVNISVTFVVYFAILFIVTTDVLASMVLGLVSKGNEKEGIKYFIPMAVTGLAIFFAARIVLLNYFANAFG